MSGDVVYPASIQARGNDRVLHLFCIPLVHLPDPFISTTPAHPDTPLRTYPVNKHTDNSTISPLQSHINIWEIRAEIRGSQPLEEDSVTNRKYDHSTGFAFSAWPPRRKQAVSYQTWGERGRAWWRTERRCCPHSPAHRRPSSVFSSHPLSDPGDLSWTPRSQGGKEDLLWLKMRICSTNLYFNFFGQRFKH